MAKDKDKGYPATIVRKGSLKDKKPISRTMKPKVIKYKGKVLKPSGRTIKPKKRGY